MPLESDLSQVSTGGAPTAPAIPSAPATEPIQSAPVPPAPAPSIPAAPAGFSLRSFVEQQGFDPAQFKDEAEMASALLDAAQQYQQAQPLAQIGQQFAPFVSRYDEIQEFLRQKDEEAAQKAAAAAALQQAPAVTWKQAKYEQALESHCDFDQQTGRWQPKHPDWAGDARQLNEVVEARRYNSQRLVDDPGAVFDAYKKAWFEEVKSTLLPQAIEAVRQELSQRDVQNETQQWVKTHEVELFQLDATGKPLVDPRSGQMVPSEKGKAVIGYAQEAQQWGVNTPAGIRAYVEKQLAADEALGKFPKTPATPAAGVPSAPANPEQRRNQFLDRVRTPRAPQRGGTIPDGTAPRGTRQNGKASLDEIVNRVAAEQGVPLTT